MSGRREEAAPDPALRERHAAIYAAGWLAPFEHWRVAPRILAGRNPLSELDVVELATLGVTHLLDLREEREWTSLHVPGTDAVEALPRHGIERRHVPIPDFSAPLPADFAAASAFLDAVFARGDTTLYAHCRVGIQRTPTILAAWIAKRDGLTVLEAARSLRLHGYPGWPLPEQMEAAVRWVEGGG